MIRPCFDSFRGGTRTLYRGLRSRIGGKVRARIGIRRCSTRKRGGARLGMRWRRARRPDRPPPAPSTGRASTPLPARAVAALALSRAERHPARGWSARTAFTSPGPATRWFATTAWRPVAPPALRRPLSPDVRDPGAARGRGGPPARAGGCGRALRRWPVRGRRRRRRLGRGRMAVPRPVRRPRHHRRSLTARRPGRSRCAAQLPHAAGEPRVRLRRWAGWVALSLRARRPRPAAARRGRRRRPPQRRGRGADRRPAQRQPPVHEPAAGRLPARPQPARRPTARRRRGRVVGVRRGAGFAHLALPVGDPPRLPPDA